MLSPQLQEIADYGDSDRGNAHCCRNHGCRGAWANDQVAGFHQRGRGVQIAEVIDILKIDDGNAELRLGLAQLFGHVAILQVDPGRC